MHDDTWELPWTQVAKVHQAEGVLSSRLDIDIDEAALLLRAYTDEAQASLTDIALDVLASLWTGVPGLDAGPDGAASP
jgi:hypothetical protein